MFRRWILGLVCVGGVAVLAYLAVAWQPAIPPIDPPAAASFSPDLVAKGKILAEAGACLDCHTAKGGARGAGGVEIRRVFGILPSTNITPDPETGIGRWSLTAFTRALREGVARDGKHLFSAAYPFDHFTKLTDDDIGALYAYLMALPPVKTPARPDTMPFPLDIRALQATWKGIYLESGPYRPDHTHNAQWNRGAYLAEALAHCSACHTPRNLLGAEEVGHPYNGALADGWWATPLDIAPSPAPWTEAQLIAYLRTGESVPHGAALGSMQKVVGNLRALPDSDIAAISTYIVSFISYGPNQQAATAKATASPEPRNDEERYGLKRYLAVCGGCHEKPGTTPDSAKSPIGLSAALWMDKPKNFIRIVLDGIGREDGMAGPTMPGFRQQLNDADIAIIVEYLRTTRTTQMPWGDMQDTVTRIRALSATLPPGDAKQRAPSQER